MNLDAGTSEQRPLILIVDDEPTVLAALNALLCDAFRTRLARGGDRACRVARLAPRPDLILLDVEMAGADGYAVCGELKADPETRDIPVIFLSAHNDPQDVARGLALGAEDYVAKPVVPPILFARIRNQLRLVEARRTLERQNLHLESLVTERTQALREQTAAVLATQEQTILALGALAETRDNETGNHIRRTQGYVRLLCEAIGPQRRGRGEVSDADLTFCWKTAPLHDIGKVGIPDAILLKPGRLSADEFEQMKRHTLLGRQALGAMQGNLYQASGFLGIAAQIACYHHEKWNGRGYPEGLAGTAIPLSARLMAIADVYDALVSERVYKPALPHADAVDIIRAERGQQFDPDLTDCFLAHAGDFHAIAARYADPALAVEPRTQQALERG